MIISPHLKHDPYVPTCAWPKDCIVQWGEMGEVYRKRVPQFGSFFEAFPAAPNDSLFRGDAPTLEEAERKAFKQYWKAANCPGHEFEARGYTNGAGLCKHCDMFASNVIAPIYPCDTCGELTWYSSGKDEEGKLHFFCRRHHDDRRRLYPQPYDNMFDWVEQQKFCVDKLRDGEPCDHPGCLNHVTHPCEGCGRIGGRRE